MPKQIYNISTPYTAEQLFKLVADIDAYPEFLPWVVASRILSQNDNIIVAELVIKYKIFRSCYTSKVTLSPNHEIIVELVEGPFKYLKNNWRFIEEDSGTRIEFMLDFALKSSLLEDLVTHEFDNYAKKLMKAFIDRALATTHRLS